MKKTFSIGQYQARYDEQEKTWFVFKGHLGIGRIIEESGEIVFTDPTTPYDMDDIVRMRGLMKDVHEQYKLNND